jgi:hypothetical protein
MATQNMGQASGRLPGGRLVSLAPWRARFVGAFALTATLWCAATIADPIPQLTDPGEAEIAPYRNARSYVDRTASELIATIPDLKGLEPVANAQEGEQALAVILSKVGENVKQFFDKFPDTTSLEEITMERLRPDGKVETRRRQTVHYLVVRRTQRGQSALDEYRTDAMGNEVEPSGLEEGLSVTSGFAPAAIHFHPALRSESSFRYLGVQKLGRRKTAVVAFAQRPGWAQVTGEVNVGGRSALILVQGLAWIDTASYQVIRLRTDLLAPRPDVGLRRQTTEVTFAEVGFPEMPQIMLWLPHEVTVTTQWEGWAKVAKPVVSSTRSHQAVELFDEWQTRTYRNIHRYSDYQLFGSTSKLKF